MKQKRVLILHEKIGFGHTKIAEAIRDSLKEKYPKIKIKEVEVIGQEYPSIKNIIKHIYFSIVNNTPWIWEFLHQGKFSIGGNRFFINIAIDLIKGTFKNTIDNFKPDIIVSTYAFSAGVASRLKEEGYKFKLIGVATDFYLHEYWNYPNIDAYCVSTKLSKMDFAKKGVNENKIFVTGIPVAKKFLKKTSYISIRKKLKLDLKLPVILVIGGGAGIIKLSSILNNLEKVKKRIQIIVVTGTNKKLYNELREKKFENKIKIFGFIDNVDEFMEISEFIIGKAGGSLLSESLAKRVPTIIYGNLFAQERLNTQYIVNNKLGFFIEDNDELEKLIDELIDNPEKLKVCKKNMEKFSMDQANKKVMEVIINSFQQIPEK